jgi:hypothetical protein
MLKARMLVIILSLVTALGASGCTEHSREGAVIGAATGAGVGLLGGGGVVRGAATGAAVGGAGGYIYDKVRD